MAQGADPATPAGRKPAKPKPAKAKAGATGGDVYGDINLKKIGTFSQFHLAVLIGNNCQSC
jgi:hypothetical protein